MPDREALGDELAEPADPEPLGRVVAAGEEVDAILARLAHHGFTGLAGDQSVQPERARLVQGEAARPGDDPDGGDPIGARVEDQWILAYRVGEPAPQLV